MNRNKEAKSLTFWRGSEDSQVMITTASTITESRPLLLVFVVMVIALLLFLFICIGGSSIHMND